MILNFKEYMTEMPKLVSPTTFNFDDEKYNYQLAKRLSSKNPEILESFNDETKLFKSGNKIFLISEGYIEFYVEYKEEYYSLINKTVTSQIKIWRGNTGIENLPSKVFFNYILNNTGIVVTDFEQTDDGKLFWIDRINQAINNNLFVYYISLLAPKKELVRINSQIEFKRLIKEKQIWGYEKSNHAKRLIISKIDLEK